MPEPAARPSDAAAYFAAASAAFDGAVRRVGGSSRAYLQVGPATLAFEFAGPALGPRLLPAMSHHLTEPVDSPGLRVRIWDTGSTSVRLPRSPWSEGSYEAGGTRFDFRHGRVLYKDDRFRMYFYQASDVVLLDFERGEAVCWFQDAETVPQYESGAPLRTLLQWWLERLGLMVVHSAAVGFRNGGVLLAGRGGSGKSTTALLCLKSDLLYVADDYCIVEPGPEPRAFCLYNTGKVDADTLAHVPELMAYVHQDRLKTEKALIFLTEHLPHKIIKSFPIRGLLVPQVTGRTESSIIPTTKADGLRALAPSTMFQQAGSGDASFRPMTQLVRDLPVFRLMLGSDTTAIPKLISRFIATGLA